MTLFWTALAAVFTGALALVMTHGHFAMEWMWLLPVWVILSLLGVPSFLSGRSGETSERVGLAVVILFACTPFLAGRGLPALLIYPQNPSLIPLMNAALFAVAPLAVLIWHFSNRGKSQSASALFYVALAAVAIAGTLVILISPAPIIDTWSVHEQATRALLQGRNPYTIEYDNIYPEALRQRLTPFGVHFPYPPGILFWMLPWKVLGLDTRFAFVFAHLLTAWALFRIARPRGIGFFRFLPGLLFAAFPVFPFITEQAWNDPVSILFVALAALAIVETRRTLFFASIGALLCLKQYNLIAVFFLLLHAQRAGWAREIRGFWLRALGPAVAIYGIFLALDWRNFLGSFYGLHHLKNPDIKQVFTIRTDAFSILNWVYLKTGFFSSAVFVVVTLILIGWLFRKAWQKADLPLTFAGLAAIYLGMFAFAPVAFTNYYWLVLGFFFVAFALSRGADGKGVFCAWYPPKLESPVFAFLASRLYVIFSWIPAISSDTFYYWRVSGNMGQGQAPFLDFPFEYPPLAAFVMRLPGIFQEMGPIDHPVAYQTWHRFIYFLLDAGFFAFLYRRYKRGEIRRSGLWVYVTAGLLLGEVIYDRFDLGVGVLMALAIFAMSQRAYLRSAAVIALGFFLKLVPIVFAPLLALSAFSSGRRREFWLSLALGAALLVSGSALFWYVYGEKLAIFFEFHRARPVQLESFWAALAFVASYADPDAFSIVQGFGGYNLAPGSGVWQGLANFAVLPVLLILYLWITLGIGEQKRWAFILMTAWIVFGKVLSPQFLVWLICLFPLAGYSWESRRERKIIVSFALALALTVPVLYLYMDLISGREIAWWVLVARNFALAFMFGAALFAELGSASAKPRAQGA